jgi:uncharacterized membrane protein YidH (DUF202 family)
MKRVKVVYLGYERYVSYPMACNDVHVIRNLLLEACEIPPHVSRSNQMLLSDGKDGVALSVHSLVESIGYGPHGRSVNFVVLEMGVSRVGGHGVWGDEAEPVSSRGSARNRGNGTEAGNDDDHDEAATEFLSPTSVGHSSVSLSSISSSSSSSASALRYLMSSAAVYMNVLVSLPQRPFKQTGPSHPYKKLSTSEYVNIDSSPVDDVGDGSPNDDNLADITLERRGRIERAPEFRGDAIQNQLTKFQRILAHLVNERTILAWFRTNLAFVTLSFKYMKLAESYPFGIVGLLLLFCGGLFMVVLPWSWYAGFHRFEVCKDLIDYDITKLSAYLHIMGFDYQNMALGLLVMTSFVVIIVSSTIIIWTSDPSGETSV